MRVGLYEDTVVDDDSVAFEERNIVGKVYICGKARKEYRVAVRIHRDQDGKFPVQYSHVSLSIDGVYVKYHLKLVLDASNSDFREATIFRGYREARRTYRTFQFSAPLGDSVEKDTESQQGCIHVEFLEACVSGATRVDSDSSSTGTLKSTDEQFRNRAIPRSKKFLKTPSLATVPGNVWVYKRSKKTKSRAVWRDARPAPDASFDIWYHTESKLKFLQEYHDARVARATANAIPVDLTRDECHAPKEDLTQTACKRKKIAPVDLTAEGVSQIEPLKAVIALVTPPGSINKPGLQHDTPRGTTKYSRDEAESEQSVRQQPWTRDVPVEDRQKPAVRSHKRSRTSGVDSLVTLTRAIKA